MQSFKYIECQYVNMTILKNYVFRLRQGIVLFPRKFESATFKNIFTNELFKIESMPKQDYQMSYKKGNDSWKFIEHGGIAFAKYVLRRKLNEPEYTLVNVVINN
jgi:hypothetical protein